MAEHTHISWADGTFNPWIGCQKVGMACDFCYAETWGKRFGVSWGPHEARRRTSDSYWLQLRRWSRKAEKAGTRPFIFGGSLCDVFDNAVDPGWRREYFEEVRQSPALVLLFLTKRPGNIVAMSEAAGGLPPNAALGATMVLPWEVRRDAPELVKAKELLNPLFVFASCEPLAGYLGPSLRPWLPWTGRLGIDWVIGGGESGPQARGCHPRWARDLNDAARDGEAVFHWKQWGEFLPSSQWRDGDPERMGEPVQFEGYTAMRVGKKLAGRRLDGVVYDGRPKVPALVAA